MPSQISAADRILFDSLVKHHYALSATDDLSGAHRTKDAMGAATVKFQVIGTVSMTRKNPRTVQPTTNPTVVNVTATIQDHYVAVPLDIQEGNKIAFDQLAEHAPVVADAVKRRALQIKINALNASASTLAVAKTYGPNNGMNAAKVQRAVQLLNKKNVPPTERHGVITANAAAQLINDAKLSDYDLSAIRRLQDARLGDWHGIMFHVLGDGTTEDPGLPNPTGNDRTNFIWHKESLGWCDQLRNTSLEWSVEQDCWLAKGRLSAEAIAIEDSTNANFGIVKITSDDEVAMA